MNANTFIKAAKLVSEDLGPFGCCQSLINGEKDKELVVENYEFFRDLFYYDSDFFIHFGYYRADLHHYWWLEEDRLARSLALLFAAEILEEEKK